LVTGFDFSTAGRIVFRRGAALDIVEVTRSLGTRAFVVTGLAGSARSRILERLDSAGLLCDGHAQSGEPTIGDATRGASFARDSGCDVVVAVGGGSAIDRGKAISALAANPGDPLEFLEVIGAGRPLKNAPLPFIAIPATAGTGSEVTRNAVLCSPAHKVKVSLRSALMLPRVALVDPELTFDLPAPITASTGMDALTQLIEPYVSVRANAITDMFCRQGMIRVRRSLERAVETGGFAGPRQDMACASLLSGLALSHAGLGIVHGFAAAIGGMFDAPHGALCAALLPHGMRVNIAALGDRDPHGAALKRYGRVAAILTRRKNAGPEAGADWVEELCGRLKIPALATHGVTSAHVAELAGKAAEASSTKGNPITLSIGEMQTLLRAALQ
jgi:alcohol dehydrogenase class IV